MKRSTFEKLSIALDIANAILGVLLAYTVFRRLVCRWKESREWED